MKKHPALALAALGLTAAGLVGTGVVASADDKEVAPAGAPQPIGDRFGRTELFFGTEKPGPDVTNEEFRRFVRREVTPRFPDGLTQYDALGQFKDSAGRIVKERSKVIVLLYPAEVSQPSSVKIEEIRDAYEDAFDQESVLRADSVDLVSF